MSEPNPESPEKDPPPVHRHKWTWRRVIVTLSTIGIVLTILVGIGAVVALNHLEWLTKWSIERAIPGVTATFGRVQLNGWDELAVRRFELRDTASGDLLLELASGRVSFSGGDFLHGNLREIELTKPRILASQQFFNLLAQRSNPGGAPADLALPLWAVERLRIHDATLTVPASAAIPANIEATFSLDWKPFGLGGEAGDQILEVAVRQIRAAIPGSDSDAISIPEAHASFSLNELIGKRRLRSLWIAESEAQLGSATWKALQAYQPTPQTEGSRSPFVIGSLHLPAFTMELEDLPPPALKAKLRIAGTFTELGDPLSQQAQTATISGIEVDASDGGAPLFQMDELAVQFTSEGLLRREIDQILLKNPELVIRDGFLKPVSKPPRGGRVATVRPDAVLPGAGWKVAAIRCPYGQLKFEPQVPGLPLVSTKFAFQLQNFGTGAGLADQLHRLILWDLQVKGAVSDERPILAIDAASVDFSLRQMLSERRVESVHVSGGRLRIGDSLAALVKAGKSDGGRSTGNATGANGWTIGKLDLQGIRTRLDDARPEVSDIFVTINTTLDNLPLSLAASELLDELRLLEFADVEIRSPVNREILILKLRSVFVRFTISELLRNELREVVILRPTIYLNQDLFLYMERATAKREEPGAPSASPPPNWKIGKVEAKFGRLVIGGGGGADVGLPLNFETKAQNVAFDNLAELQLEAALRIPKQSYAFASYQIELDDVEGDLRFSYPPEKGEKNLVQKLDIGEIRWRQYQAGKSWVAVTFDRRGINGQFGGGAYSGYINGGFSFFFQNGSPWIGWISGTDVDTGSLTKVISPQNFKMTGPLSFEVQLDAFGKSIDRMIGKFGVSGGGTMTITKLDDMLKNIPDTWPAIKQSSTRIGLETLRDFEYTRAGGQLWFVQQQGVLNLDLEGPAGSRRFELFLHDGAASEGLWQIGSSGNKEGE